MPPSRNDDEYQWWHIVVDYHYGIRYTRPSDQTHFNWTYFHGLKYVTRFLDTYYILMVWAQFYFYIYFYINVVILLNQCTNDQYTSSKRLNYWLDNCPTIRTGCRTYTCTMKPWHPSVICLVSSIWLWALAFEVVNRKCNLDLSNFTYFFTAVVQGQSCDCPGAGKQYWKL